MIIDLKKARPFEIPKGLVWKAWKAVKANQGVAGVDEQTIKDFESELGKGLYKIWNGIGPGYRLSGTLMISSFIAKSCVP